MVAATGVEPVTSRVWTVRSHQAELRRQLVIILPISLIQYQRFYFRYWKLFKLSEGEVIQLQWANGMSVQHLNLITKKFKRVFAIVDHILYT